MQSDAATGGVHKRVVEMRKHKENGHRAHKNISLRIIGECAAILRRYAERDHRAEARETGASIFDYHFELRPNAGWGKSSQEEVAAAAVGKSAAVLRANRREGKTVYGKCAVYVLRRRVDASINGKSGTDRHFKKRDVAANAIGKSA